MPSALPPSRSHRAFDSYETVWEDRFEGPAGTHPDPERWVPDRTRPGAKNSELQSYVSGTEAIALDGDGHLVLTARRTEGGGYTSGCLHTARRFHARTGRIEARIRVPSGQGLWPAFWMLGASFTRGTPWPETGEIDIMEILGHRPEQLHNTIHGPGYSGERGQGGFHVQEADGEQVDLSADFHVYGVDWDERRIRWWLDEPSHVTTTITAEHIEGALGRRWVFDEPFFLVLNLAVGGDWPGDPDGSTGFPAQMLVDRVRVSQRSGSDRGIEPVASRDPGAARLVLRVPSVVTSGGGMAQCHVENGDGSTGTAAREAEGTLRIQLDDEIQEVSLREGRASVDLAALMPGAHVLRATLSDLDVALASTEVSATFRVV